MFYNFYDIVCLLVNDPELISNLLLPLAVKVKILYNTFQQRLINFFMHSEKEENFFHNFIGATNPIMSKWPPFL